MNNNYKVIKVTHHKGKEFDVIIQSEIGEVETLIVHEEIVIRYRLVVGKEINLEQFIEMKDKLDLGRAYQYALNVLTRKSCSVHEMRQKLVQKEYQIEIVEDVLQRLIDVGLLNDELFAIQYISQVSKSGKKGPNLIKKDLKQKGIDEAIILKNIQSYEYDDELLNATKILDHQMRTNSKYGPQYLKQKMHQSLMLKGFSSQIIAQALSTIVFEQEDEQDPILVREMEKLFRKHQKLKDYEKKTKITQTLGRKGFRFDDINQVYQEMKESFEEE
ncbi:MAG: RecX family transcriptional regulator [Turicibacter sp.]